VTVLQQRFAQGRDHGGVVATPPHGHRPEAHPRAATGDSKRIAQTLVSRHTAAEKQVAQAVAAQGLERHPHRLFDQRPLEGRAEVRSLRL
jgi:hypothetical protein